MLSEFREKAPVGAEELSVSFEFFPPREGLSAEPLMNAAQLLSQSHPAFLSVTYGAGGSTRERTIEIAKELVHKTNSPIAGHLTCVGASREEVDAVARTYWENGVRHIVALRGDAPEGSGGFVPHPEGYRNAADLVRGLKNIAPFEISVAAYPEVHPEAVSAEADLDNLKAKVDAGATRAITQFFFEPETFLRFRDRVAAHGINVDLVPGILPVGNIAQAMKFAKACGTKVPAWLQDLFEGLDDHPRARSLVTTTVASAMCKMLKKSDVKSFHFYTLNRSEASFALCRLLGCRFY
ncbi:methylenetetrahydrofolate reductase [NAD(P)H] [Acetobacter sicerae]|uniref:Methylenetetrahydrofolate reductase n=1 Tax=Acetobacter sicerae TaxID=85325 RepID=A0ABS8VUN0_9PROT|nr:methylenetetrahydrofolate reductase [NAD(P)H] [Acetobacter sicerae]MCE0742978.1 methylenetetrahydrofolate reductase [NAD(P)H] [Acetobacter sicerae]